MLHRAACVHRERPFLRRYAYRDTQSSSVVVYYSINYIAVIHNNHT